MTEMMFEFTTRIQEEEDRFILQRISAITEQKYIIPKQLLSRALYCFQTEHKEEYELLMEGVNAYDSERINQHQSMHHGHLH